MRKNIGGLLNALLKETDTTDIRTGYTAAMQMWAYQGQELWNRSTAMILTHSILLLAIFQGQLGGWVRVFGLSLGGLLLCLFWGALVHRGYAYLDYWEEEARRLEGELKSAVHVAKKPEKQLYRIGFPGFIKAQRAIYGMIILFSVGYLVLLACSVLALCRYVSNSA